MTPHRHTRPESLAKIDLTPVVGVLLVLLTVIMIATPRMVTAWQEDLPPMDFAGHGEGLEPIVVTIMADGTILLGGATPNATTTRENLLQKICAPPDASTCRRHRVIVRGEPDARYGDILMTLRYVENAGFRAGFLNEEID